MVKEASALVLVDISVDIAVDVTVDTDASPLILEDVSVERFVETTVESDWSALSLDEASVVTIVLYVTPVRLPPLIPRTCPSVIIVERSKVAPLIAEIAVDNELSPANLVDASFVIAVAKDASALVLVEASVEVAVDVDVDNEVTELVLVVISVDKAVEVDVESELSTLVLVRVSVDNNVESDWSAANLVEASSDTPPPTAVESELSAFTLFTVSVEISVESELSALVLVEVSVDMLAVLVVIAVLNVSDNFRPDADFVKVEPSNSNENMLPFNSIPCPSVSYEPGAAILNHSCVSTPGIIGMSGESDLPNTQPELPFVTPLITNTKSPNDTSFSGVPSASTLLSHPVEPERTVQIPFCLLSVCPATRMKSPSTNDILSTVVIPL